MNFNILLKKLNEDGFVKLKAALTKDFCNKLIKRLKKIEPKVYLPYTKVPFGYGNLVDDSVFKKIASNQKLNLFLKKYFNKEIQFNHILLQDKVAWVGPSVEWHQEIFNIDTYSPGTKKSEWKKFLNIFIAIEDQDIHNGCLIVLKESHKLGELPHQDITNDLFNHKRQVKYDILCKISRKYKPVICNLRAGDILIFNHLLVHGSGSNSSQKNRKSIVMQARSETKPKNLKIFEKENKYRKNFAVKAIKEMLLSKVGKNIYKDLYKN